MIPSDSSSKTNATAASEALPLERSGADVAPPIGITPPQILAQDAATGRRGAAWRLMVWIVENDPRAVIAVSSLRTTTFCSRQDATPNPLPTRSRDRFHTFYACGYGCSA